MGNRVSSPSPARLSECDAWAIATAWHPQIYTVLGLREEFPATEIAPNHRIRPVVVLPKFSVTRSVEFVDFVLTWVQEEDVERVTLAARAATLAWFALSCCPGFGGDENPEFWWHVLLAPSAPFEYPGQIQQPAGSSFIHTSINHEFFPNADRPFPRVRVHAPFRANPTDFWRLFLFGATQRGKKSMSQVDATLAVALRKLDPFICDARWRRDVPIALCAQSRALRNVPRLLANLSERQCTNSSVSSRSKKLAISEISCAFASPSDPIDVGAILRADPSVSVRFTCCLDATIAIEHPAVNVDQLSGVQSRFQAEKLELGSSLNRVNPRDTAYFGACCSMLPHTNMIETVSVIVKPLETLLSDVNAAWLGYALFHPDTSQNGSCFTNLTLSLRSASPTALSMLKLMAQGNNLLVAMGITNVVSTEYHQVRLREGTQVWSSREQSDSHVQGEDGAPTVPLMTSNSNVWLTVCFEDPVGGSCLPSNGSVRVVVPSRGIGWVHSSSLTELRSRQPSASPVRRLCLLSNVVGSVELDAIARAEVDAVLSLLGPRLTFLEIGGGGSSATTIQTMLRYCPSLKSLRVHHNGSCWSDPSGLLLPELPRLVDLELIVNGSLQPLRAPQISSLKVLQIMENGSSTFDADREAFVASLEHCLELRTAVWRQWLDRLTHYHETAGALQGFARPGVHDVARVPLNETARVAFLSVVQRFAMRQPDHPLGRMGDRDIARHIFRFSSSSVPRKFLIYPKISWNSREV